MRVLSFSVNGIPKTVHLEEDRVMLSDVLRDYLGLTGTKIGCGVGQCGACTVIMDKKAVTSCTVPAEKAEGKSVFTIEGLAEGGKLNPIQEAFVEAGAVQCGFCTPGLVMRLFALFSENPEADDETIEEELNKHLCRCTGYETILEAACLSRSKMIARAKPS